MPLRLVERAIRGGLLCGVVFLLACHADLDDPKGQAQELDDPVRREHAIGRLQAIYSKALAAAKGDRSAESVKTVVDASVDQLVKTYVDNPDNVVNGTRILGLLQEMRDPRALPALVRALEWRAEVSEDHAVIAARTLTEIAVPDGEKAKVVEGICTALERVEGARGLDNRLRKGFIEALGKLADKGATDTLIKIALSDNSDQNFLFNILAAQQLVKIADPKAVAPMIKGLFLAPADNPAMRMNDVATSALVAVGKPALQPLMDTLAGQNEEANQAVKNYIEAIRQKDANAAANLDPSAIIAGEATYALGKIGYRDSLDALIKETQSKHPDRRFAAALALPGINRTEADTAAVVGAMTKVYSQTDKQQRPQLLVAARHLYADEVMPFLYSVAKTTEKELPPVQMYGYVSYAMLADAEESAKLKPIFDKEEMLRPHLKEMEVAIAAAKACDRKVECWVGKLGDKEKVVLRKAANMLARFGRGNQEAIAGLVKLFAHSDLEVRNEALYAVDYMATKGSQAAVDKIEEIEAREGGRSSWNNFKREALPTRSRLLLRAGS
ncbi:MAG: hypothetical protein OXU20_11600 [Myxococcales bacterium]|nr:hypothetical protein [Myxococcales bacterium]MDD9971766.1 hypothetical protein [Myxococcales bacterium]